MGIFSLFNNKKEKKQEGNEETATLSKAAEGIKKSRSAGYSDEEIIKAMFKKGYSYDDVKSAFKLAMKGGVSMPKKTGKKFEEEDESMDEEDLEEEEDEDEDDEDDREEEEEDSDEEEEVEETEEPEEKRPAKAVKTKEEKVPKAVKKPVNQEAIEVGTIRPVTQTVAFEVFKGYNLAGQEMWVPCERRFEAELLSNQYKKA